MEHGTFSDNRTEFSIFEEERDSEGSFYCLNIFRIFKVSFFFKSCHGKYINIPFLATFGEMILVKKGPSKSLTFL